MTSRSFDEYVAMFDLDASNLPAKILDCCAGVAGFRAEAARRGSWAVAADPAYALPREKLAEMGRDDLLRGSAIAGQYAGSFTFDWYGGPERRLTLRKAALAQFVVDLATNPSSFVAGQLPQLPFRDMAFDLAVCSHLLFTWADQLGLDWHLAALVELARVAAYVRVFPTVMQGPGEPVPFMDELMSGLERDGLRVERRQVGYEFQRGANTMLIVSRDRTRSSPRPA